ARGPCERICLIGRVVRLLLVARAASAASAGAAAAAAAAASTASTSACIRSSARATATAMGGDLLLNPRVKEIGPGQDLGPATGARVDRDDEVGARAGQDVRSARVAGLDDLAGDVVEGKSRAGGIRHRDGLAGEERGVRKIPVVDASDVHHRGV